MRFAIAVLCSSLTACQLFLDPGDVSPPPDPDASEPCVPKSCESEGALCGEIEDGCGGRAACAGKCVAPETCGGGGVANACGRREICTATGWCWENPLPQGESLFASHGFSANDVWLAGARGTVLRWDGASWSRLETGVPDNLDDLWGADPGAIWFAAEQGLLLWDGRAFTRKATPVRVAGLWGRSRDEVWAVGAKGTALRFDGAAWRDSNAPATTETLMAVVGCGDEVFAVGTNGYSLRRGAAWSQEETGVTGTLSGLACVDGKPWAAGNRELVRWTGTRWEPDSPPLEGIAALWSPGDATAWILGTDGALAHWDGEEWKVRTGAMVPGLLWGTLWGAGPDDVWAAGSYGAMLHYDGAAWSRFSKGETGVLAAVWGASPEALWAVGGIDSPLIVRRRPDGCWAQEPSEATAGLSSVHGISGAQAWAVGRAGQAVRWNGSSWRRSPTLTDEALQAVWAFSAQEAWAVGGQGLILRFDGSTWTRQDSGTTSRLLDVWGATPADLWAVGASGTVLRRSAGGAWAPSDLQIGKLCAANSVHGTSAQDLWVATDDSACRFHHFKSGWTQAEVPASLAGSGDGLRLFAFGPSDLWAPRDEDLLHWNGSRWSLVATGTSKGIGGVWGEGRRLWAVGGGGMILRKDLEP